MSNWRRQRRPQNRNPPPGGSRQLQQSVPSWEKKFCSVVGCIPWRKFLEKKNFTHIYPKVLNWNDSAGEEAFRNAKNRFWADLNGLPCDIPLPDPNMYIDEIDWNSTIDPEQLIDLKHDFVVPVDEQVVILDELHIANHLDYTIGWGAAEEDFKTGLALENKGSPWQHTSARADGPVGVNDTAGVFNDSRGRNEADHLHNCNTGWGGVEPLVSNQMHHSTGWGVAEPLSSNQLYSSTGWGDA
ncbi:uncharacterized protein LOC127789013 [Diospyros lotus]|uniref:uncharacterized protein LOC127789013 n=1 Tax=Diospyros lotus TaxID=55363 RepID=UPI00224D78C8|nr:uncharacterized protein LOC127789013 [Diospyros lotus]XP_052173703.1 uncharacterized protein LOC127789013 [Diospyros lotus]